MLKYQLDTLDGLDDSVKELYTEKDGKFTLGIDGLPKTEDVSGLKKKVDELLKEAKSAKDAKKAVEDKAAEDAAVAAQKSGDVDAINSSWQKKFNDGIAAITAERDNAMTMLRTEKVHSKAVELATNMAVPGSAEVLLPHIERRLTMDIRDGRAVAVVLDQDGKPSALTVEELGKEFASTAAFAPLIIASNSAGGGANGKQHGRAAAKTATRAEFNSWSPVQQSKFSVEGGQLT